MFDIITIGNDVLKEKATLISDIDDNIINLINEMTEILEKKNGVGLAAPQIGEKKRIFITKVPGDILRVFINPEIIQTSQELETYEEGCLSIPGVWANVVRPSAIIIQAYDIKGKIFKIEVDGVLSRVIQHELDHLNGILFTDRLNDKQREKVLKIYDRKNNPK
ncbi:MAG: peptide deformylase [Spirochaetaceae bacterium]|nr:peptide deformylase [Spirochaetaceae bacterium]